MLRTRESIAQPGEPRWIVGHATGVCPRCAYRGDGISYFSRGRNVACLVGLTVLTVGAMGVGGLIYFVVRKDHKLCPRCGYGWGSNGERSLMRPSSPSAAPASPRVTSGSTARGWSILLFALAAFLVLVGVAGEEIAPLIFAAAAGGAGFALHRSAQNAKEHRRAAQLSSHQLPVLKLASRRQGRLTVTDVAAELGWTLGRAEKVLQSLDDGIRVTSEVTDEGIIVFEFRELLHAPGRSPEQDIDRISAPAAPSVSPRPT
ncbi:MAG TPA: hypothetical protein VFI91_06140 [Longimicrobiaceae bacterium]|nr:hypothetical protein [Longimicrobiaceae bacterium]